MNSLDEVPFITNDMPYSGQTSRHSHNSYKPLLVGIVAILGITISITSLIATTLIAQKPSQEKKSFAAVDVDQVQQYINAPVVSQESPWGYSTDTVVPEPAPLSLSQYHQLFLQVRTAITSRNFSEFSNLASTQKVWHISNPFNYVGDGNQGGMVGTKINLTPEQNFIDNAVSQILFNSPSLSNISPTSVVSRQFFNDQQPIVIVDQLTTTGRKYIQTPWRYTVDVQYSVSSPYSGSGYVTFVWDSQKNKWTYLAEVWTVKKSAGGRVSVPSSVLDSAVVIPLDNVDNFEAAVNVSVGQTVVWQNVTGSVFSVSPSVEVWNSDFLHGESYSRQFNSAGTYYYQADIYSSGSKDIVRGVIYVR